MLAQKVLTRTSLSKEKQSKATKQRAAEHSLRQMQSNTLQKRCISLSEEAEKPVQS